ncbi:MAG: hypothetical protein ABSB15_06110 [Bryobacteraceae bacterium]|jgi:sugar lactone lactonase YvrE
MNVRLLTPVFLILALCASAAAQGYTIHTLAPDAARNVSGSIAADPAGNVYYVADPGNVVFRVDAATGQVSRFAGTEKAGYSGDGGPAALAQLRPVFGLAADAEGNVYIADSENRRIRKVSNGVITTFAGNGTDGYSGDNGPATSAQSGALSGVAVDPSGNVYIADNINNVIRRVSHGIITTIAGNGVKLQGSVPPDQSDDNGPALGAQLYFPAGVAADAAGNVYIADYMSSRIRKVSGGSITTLAGFRTANSYWGDNGPAVSAGLFLPNSVAVDAAGNVYTAEGTPFNGIRKVSGGVIVTIAGNGKTTGYSGDNGPATSAQLGNPLGVAVDAAGKVYIADAGNHVIRVLVPDSPHERVNPTATSPPDRSAALSKPAPK